jgi:gliding motility-associated-like protein
MATAQLQLNTVSTTPSTCPNNGTITISASTGFPPLIYSLPIGPVTGAPQTTNVFSSLPPGTYTVRVSDGSGAFQQQTAVITGTYVNLDFTTTVSSPYCEGDNNGSITGIPVPGTGVAPFSWELLPPSPVMIPPQSSNVLGNLPAGDYTIRMADACNNLRTLMATINDPNTAFTSIAPPILYKIGCDSILASFTFNAQVLRTPYTIAFQTSNGVFIPPGNTVIDTSQFPGTHNVTVHQLFPGLTYGDYVQAIVTNSCGDQITTQATSLPFAFSPAYTFGQQCSNAVTALFKLISIPNSGGITIANDPLTYSLTHVATGVLIAADTLFGQSITIPIDATLEPGNTYYFHITDGCGEQFDSSYTVPFPPSPGLASQGIFPPTCIDSVIGTLYVTTVNFSSDARLILLSGPATFGSTDPELGYTNSYTYPDTVPAAFPNSFYLQTIAPGTYTYQVIDGCGNEIAGSITVNPQEVMSLDHYADYRKGCPGQNALYFSVSPMAYITVTDLSTNTVLYHQMQFFGAMDSLINLSSGSYEVNFAYTQTEGIPIDDQEMPCQMITDTITIPPYTFPGILLGNPILCSGTLFLEALADSTQGIPPYQYEIIAGPQLFPLQSSSAFQISEAGTYTIRIHDACGNATANLLSVGQPGIPVAEITADCHLLQASFPSSAYNNYEWMAPDGSVFTGDHLVLDPVTFADTGNYTILQITEIGSCSDTVTLTQHVSMQHFHEQVISLCPGGTVTIGSHTYNTPGTYLDTLPTASGCDSLLATTLITDVMSDTLVVNICYGTSYEAGGMLQNAAGFYTDSLLNSASCYDYLVTDLRIDGGAFTFDVSICDGDSMQLGDTWYTSEGTYTDTFPNNSGCDSIVTMTLTVLLHPPHLLSATICAGDSYVFDGIPLNLPGIYTQTFPSEPCDSTVVLDLTVLPLKQGQETHYICDKESLTVNGYTYDEAGSYSEVYPTTDCDSIVTRTIVTYPLPIVQAIASNYYVEPGDTVQLDVLTTDHPLQYSWTGEVPFSDPTVPDPVAAIGQSGWITVTVSDTNGCQTTDRIYIGTGILSTLFLPNAFTPNGDEHNNVFRVSYSHISRFDMHIFDRWGTLVYASTDIDSGWDGTYNDLPVPDGIYTCTVVAIGMDGRVYDFTGHLSVLK